MELTEKEEMSKTVDSFRFVSGITRRMVETWIKKEEPRPIPWTPMARPLSECTVALISSGGIAMKDDAPFDQEGERRNPWWGDPSFRVIPKSATEKDVGVYHLHINPTYALRDLNCLLPLRQLEEMELQGEIGKAAASHYSIMGYLLQPEAMLQESVPAIIQCLKDEGVDIVVLVPS
jgi:D-proline reductase (dithiol) PrdB